jgi:hypothetical protein
MFRLIAPQIALIYSLAAVIYLVPEISAYAQEGLVSTTEVSEKGEWSRWKSKHWKFAVAWKQPNKILVASNTVDTPQNTMISLMNGASNTSLIAIVSPAISEEQVDNEMYSAALKQQQQLQAPGRKVIDERKIKLSGTEFFSIGFRGDGEKGPVITRVMFNRGKDKTTVLMLTFLEGLPLDESTQLPKEFIEKIRVRL